MSGKTISAQWYFMISLPFSNQVFFRNLLRLFFWCTFLMTLALHPVPSAFRTRFSFLNAFQVCNARAFIFIPVIIGPLRAARLFVRLIPTVGIWTLTRARGVVPLLESLALFLPRALRKARTVLSVIITLGTSLERLSALLAIWLTLARRKVC